MIWVEGPSDRIYVKKWIDLFSDTPLKEGRDYSFLYFGGTNLASFTVLDDEDNTLINMLSTSRKAYLIADSDCSSRETRDKNTYKKYLNDMLARRNMAVAQNQGSHSSANDYLKIWITAGREVENYIPKDLLFTVLTSSGIKRESITKDDIKNELEIADATSFSFGEFDSFDNKIAECYKFKGSSKIDEESKKNISLSYAAKKVRIAKTVSEKLNRNHCDMFDLEMKITELVNFIKC